ncbi:MAG: lyase family protein [Pseudomonadota bacterium]
MPASPLDSALYARLLGDPKVAALFTDSAEVRAMLIVEGALARVQGEIGLIPKVSAEAIHRASMEVQVDPGGLAEATGQNAVPVPALVAAFRTEMQAPAHAQYVHWGATSQDIMDTALALRLRQVLTILGARLASVVAALGAMSDAHAELPMAARTYGQVATVTSFGAIAAEWGRPLMGAQTRLEAVRGDVQMVSLSGAGGTLSMMGDAAPKVRAALAEALGLDDPGASWHSARDGVAGLAAWLTAVTGALGKMGDDLHLMAQSGVGEVALPGAGASSTMPQKANPVQPAVLTAIARQCVGLNAVMQGAVLHRQQRDGAAWMTEWMTLPQMCILAARALAAAETLAQTVVPRAEAMLDNLDDGLGLIYAEAATFALAADMPRPEAQAIVKALCAEATETGTPLPSLLARDHAGDWAALLRPAAQMGQAPADARAFASEARQVT